MGRLRERHTNAARQPPIPSPKKVKSTQPLDLFQLVGVTRLVRYQRAAGAAGAVDGLIDHVQDVVLLVDGQP